MQSSKWGSLALVVFFILMVFFIATLPTVDTTSFGSGVNPQSLPMTSAELVPVQTVTGMPFERQAAPVRILVTPTVVLQTTAVNRAGTTTTELVTYTVQPGEWLRAIALRYGTTVATILELNPQIPDPDLVQPGQEILLPVPVE